MIEVIVKFDKINPNAPGIDYNYTLFGTLNESDMSGTLHLNGDQVFEVRWKWEKVSNGETERTVLYPDLAFNSDRFWRKCRCGRAKMTLMVQEVCIKLENHILLNIIEDA